MGIVGGFAMTDDHQKQRERFFSLVGYAITRWAYIDRSLFDFCKFALNANDIKTAIIFYRSPSIGDHLELTNALMSASGLPPETLEWWNLIAQVAKDQLPYRNDLAHNPPVQTAHITVVGEHVTKTEQWTEIQTEPTKLLHKSKRSSARKISATADQVSDHIRKVEQLEQAIAALRWKLMGPPPGLSPTIQPPPFPQNLGQ
jgi:hypothetical protein